MGVCIPPHPIYSFEQLHFIGVLNATDGIQLRIKNNVYQCCSIECWRQPFAIQAAVYCFSLAVYVQLY